MTVRFVESCIHPYSVMVSMTNAKHCASYIFRRQWMHKLRLPIRSPHALPFRAEQGKCFVLRRINDKHEAVANML